MLEIFLCLCRSQYCWIKLTATECTLKATSSLTNYYNKGLLCSHSCWYFTFKHNHTGRVWASQLHPLPLYIEKKVSRSCALKNHMHPHCRSQLDNKPIISRQERDETIIEYVWPGSALCKQINESLPSWIFTPLSASGPVMRILTWLFHLCVWRKRADFQTWHWPTVCVTPVAEQKKSPEKYLVNARPLISCLALVWHVRWNHL